MAIGRTGDPALAAAVGTAIAREMRALGLAWNFAPVADVNNNPHNPIINTRAFGDDPWTVIRYAQPLAAAMQQSGVAACAKHFPGHGDTTVDSHRALPVMTINPAANDIFGFRYEDFTLAGYDPHPHIKAEVAV